MLPEAITPNHLRLYSGASNAASLVNEKDQNDIKQTAEQRARKSGLGSVLAPPKRPVVARGSVNAAGPASTAGAGAGAAAERKAPNSVVRAEKNQMRAARDSARLEAARDSARLEAAAVAATDSADDTDRDTDSPVHAQRTVAGAGAAANPYIVPMDDVSDAKDFNRKAAELMAQNHNSGRMDADRPRPSRNLSKLIAAQKYSNSPKLSAQPAPATHPTPPDGHTVLPNTTVPTTEPRPSALLAFPPSAAGPRRSLSASKPTTTPNAS
jgi:hypothetical protein